MSGFDNDAVLAKDNDAILTLTNNAVPGATANPVPRDRVEAFVEWMRQPPTRSDVGPTTVAWNAGWDAALAVQATETEALKAALTKIEGAPTSWLEADSPVRRIARAALTDHGTSLSQDAQEPT